jgi:hypothetical protein
MHHLSILYPLRDLLQQQRVLNVVKRNRDTLPIISTFPKELPLFVLVIPLQVNRSPFLGPRIDTVACISF